MSLTDFSEEIFLKNSPQIIMYSNNVKLVAFSNNDILHPHPLPPPLLLDEGSWN